MAFYISGPKLLFETTEISTQQESNYIYLYTTKFGTSKKNSTQPEIRVNRVRDNESQLYIVLVSFIGIENHWPAASRWQTLSHNVSSTSRQRGIWTHH